MKNTLMRWLYNFLFTLAIPIDGLRLCLRALKMPGAQRRWSQRLALGLNIPQDKPIIWLHAVSLGEVNLSVPLVEAILAQYPNHHLLITTTTLTGSQAVSKHFSTRVLHCYFPYDQPWVSKRFLDQIKPQCFIIMETEIWPNHLRHCQQQNIPVIILNARLSQRSARRYQRLQSWFERLWQAIHYIGAQSEQDRQRFIEIGFPESKISVTGNLKYEIKVNEALFTQAAALKSAWGEDRPVWIAASTHEGEEKIILDTFSMLRQHIPNLLLILVPRHPQRFEQVAKLVESQALASCRRSDQTAQPGRQTQIYLVDTIGELNLFYAASDVAFVGGSLVEIGGHNIIEPASYTCTVVVGPHTFNCTSIVEHFQQAGAAIVVHSSHVLKETLHSLFSDRDQNQRLQENARCLLHSHQGSLASNMAIIKRHCLV